MTKYLGKICTSISKNKIKIVVVGGEFTLLKSRRVLGEEPLKLSPWKHARIEGVSPLWSSGRRRESKRVSSSSKTERLTNVFASNNEREKRRKRPHEKGAAAATPLRPFRARRNVCPAWLIIQLKTRALHCLSSSVAAWLEIKDEGWFRIGSIALPHSQDTSRLVQRSLFHSLDTQAVH